MSVIATQAFKGRSRQHEWGLELKLGYRRAIYEQYNVMYKRMVPISVPKLLFYTCA
jgi:hypothetical protein